MEKIEVSNGGIKHDTEKIRTELLPVLAIEEISKVLTFGAKKYAADNWRLGFNWRRVIGALLRHIYAFMRGEDLDPETGLSHLAHAGCCLLFLLQFWLTGAGTDDRVREARRVRESESPAQDSPSPQPGPDGWSSAGNPTPQEMAEAQATVAIKSGGRYA